MHLLLLALLLLLLLLLLLPTLLPGHLPWAQKYTHCRSVAPVRARQLRRTMPLPLRAR